MGSGSDMSGTVLQAILARLAEEVADLAARSRTIEGHLAVETERPAHVDIQDLDSLTQHLEGTASVLHALASAAAHDQTIDQAWLGRVTGSLRLQGLAGRLAGQRAPHGEPSHATGEYELW